MRLRAITIFIVTIFISANTLWAARTDLVLATASTGGTYYPVGVALATLTSIKLAKSDQITMNAITSAGSGENIELLKSGEAQMAILQGLFGSMAWQGLGRYDGKKQEHLRSITMLWENVEHFTVHAEYAPTGNIEDLKQFKKAKFSIGSRNSGSRVSAETILQELGIDPAANFSIEYLSYTPSSTAMQDGRIRGMNTPAGPPVSAVTQAFARMGGDLRVLQFTDEQIQTVNQTYPVWSRYTVPASTYPGQSKAIQTIAQPNFLAIHPDVDEEVVYKLTKTIYENLLFLHGIHKATRAMKLERAIVGLPVPLHPGAARYYEEKGIVIPSALVAN